MPEVSNSDRVQLRNFGLITGFLVAVIAGVLLPRLKGYPFPYWPWFLAGALWACAFATPSWLRILFTLWVRIGLLLNRISTAILLGVTFYGIVAPLGTLMRWFGREPMARRWDADAESYKIKSARTTRESMENPY